MLELNQFHQAAGRFRSGRHPPFPGAYFPGDADFHGWWRLPGIAWKRGDDVILGGVEVEREVAGPKRIAANVFPRLAQSSADEAARKPRGCDL